MNTTLQALPSAFPLINSILEMSKADSWVEAVKEWDLSDITVLKPGDEDAFCLCGHNIRELCHIENSGTGNQAIVGNCCIKKFLSSEVATSARRVNAIKKEIGKALDEGTIARALEAGWISDWEAAFYTSTQKKRKLSTKQFNIRTRINRAVLLHLCPSHQTK